MERCEWCLSSEIYIEYHDKEWGVPVFDDIKLFEMLILEGAQAGLSWITILKRRESYRKAYDNFNPHIVSKYDDFKLAELLKDEGIIRNKLKIKASVINANKFIEIQKEFGSFSNYIWRFVDNKQITNNYKFMNELPTKTELSDKISKDLKKRGFKFVGSTIIYSFLQAVGVINDHLVTCKRHSEIASGGC